MYNILKYFFQLNSVITCHVCVQLIKFIYIFTCICGASRQKSTYVGNFKIELGAGYDSRSVHLSFKTKIMFLSISFAKLWYNSLLWNRGVSNINFAEIGSKVPSVKNTEN